MTMRPRKLTRRITHMKPIRASDAFKKLELQRISESLVFRSLGSNEWEVLHPDREQKPKLREFVGVVRQDAHGAYIWQLWSGSGKMREGLANSRASANRNIAEEFTRLV